MDHRWGATRASARRPLGWYVLWLALTALVGAMQYMPLFWDTVQLAGKHATFYWSTNFGTWWLPQGLDSGHPPTFGMYLAACWKLFGRSLPTSHWAMYPWLLLWAGGVWRTVGHWVAARWQIWIVLLLLVDPVWLGQAVLVSPDIWVMAGFWWALVGILENRRAYIVPATALLALTSTRGMMAVAALYVIRVVWDVQAGAKPSPGRWCQLLVPFLPAALSGAAFLWAHYNATGWIGYHTASPWAPSFERVGLAGFLRNGAVLGWRVLDFGRVIPVLILLGAGIGWRNLWHLPDWQRWSAALLVLGSFLFPSLLLYKGLSGHRYLLPLLQWLLVGLGFLITQLKNSRQKIIIYVVCLISLVAGHRWIYPRAISQQWDATLAHLPYQSLRLKVFRFLDEREIAYDSVGTAFPEIGPRDWRELTGDRAGLVDHAGLSTPYIWYSNVMNDFSDAELRVLDSFPVVARWNSGGVEVVLYQQPAK